MKEERREKVKMSKTQQEPKVIKSSMNLPEDLWKRLSIYTIQNYGGRQKNDVVLEILDEYLKARNF